MAKSMTLQRLQSELRKLESRVAKLRKKKASALEKASALQAHIDALLGGATTAAPEPVAGGKKRGRKPGRKRGRKPGRKPGKRGPGRPPKAGKPGRKPGKRGPGRPPKAGKPGRKPGKRGPGRPPKAAGKPGRPPKASSGPSLKDAALAIVKAAGKPVSMDKLVSELGAKGFRYKNTKQLLLMQAKRIGLKKDGQGNLYV